MTEQPVNSSKSRVIGACTWLVNNDRDMRDGVPVDMEEKGAREAGNLEGVLVSQET